MKSETTQVNDTPYSASLYLAIELSQAEWKLGFTVGLGQAARLRSVNARDLKQLEAEIHLAKVRFGLPEATPVCSCYEAGRDGFLVGALPAKHRGE